MENEQNPGGTRRNGVRVMSVSIQNGIFIKIMKKKEPEEGEKEIFYTIFPARGRRP
jgi:hypothetical protein